MNCDNDQGHQDTGQGHDRNSESLLVIEESIVSLFDAN